MSPGGGDILPSHDTSTKGPPPRIDIAASGLELGGWQESSTTDTMPKRRPLAFMAVLGALLLTSFFTPLRIIPSAYRGSTSYNVELAGAALEGEVERLEGIAWNRMLRNIGPQAGAGDGLVIASPSTGKGDEPDYFYTWTRDSALIISTILPAFLPSSYLPPWAFIPSPHATEPLRNTSDPLLEPLIRAYISSQRDLQLLATRSGDLKTGGLNEPKFHADGRAFDGDWGRPQRDGPALRALAIIPYAHFLLDRAFPADVAFVRSHLYDPSYIVEPGRVVKNDLEEVAHGWRKSSFDLWEEVDGHHLWNIATSIRALEAGAILATRLKDNGAAEYYQSQVDEMIKYLGNFKDGEGIWRGLDCAIPLSYIHTAGGDGSKDQVFIAGDSSSLASMRAYLLSFQDLYDVNGDKDWTEGWLVGRYAEDVYDGKGFTGGNPWFICTFATAQFFYLAETQFMEAKSVHIDNTSAGFWDDLLDDTWADHGHGLYRTAAARVRELGDRYMAAGMQRISEEGRMSEQIDRHSARQVGARDLTWSYASFVSAARARRAIGDSLGN